MKNKKHSRQSNASNKYPDDYAWKYFELHANQRISLFRMYFVILSLYITGSGFLLIRFHRESHIEEIGLIVLSIVFIFMTLIFWLLDKRNRTLIKIAEASLKKCEEDKGDLDVHKLFTNESIISEYCGQPRHTQCFEMLYSFSLFISFLILFASYFHCEFENKICAISPCQNEKKIAIVVTVDNPSKEIYPNKIPSK